MSDELVSIIWIAVLVAFAYLLFIRPARTRAKEVQSIQKALSRGDEIMLTSGIFGEVVNVVDDKVMVEVSPGVVLTVHRGAVGKMIRDVPADSVIAEEPTEWESEDGRRTGEPESDEPTDGDTNTRGAH